MRLLAVDDDPQILDLLPRIFRQAGLPGITVASSADAALELISDPNQGFDGLILDIHMPGMNGIDLCRTVRAMPHYRTTPILMLSAMTGDGHIERAFAAGADDFISKPFDVKDLANRVRVAKRMSERAVQAPTLLPRAVDRQADAGLHAYGLHDPVRLAGSPQLILPFALGNYLSQLSRRRLDLCSIFALRLQQMEALYDAAKPHEFARLMQSVVRAITKGVDWPQMLLTYEGNGSFLCITQGTEPPVWPYIELEIEEALRNDASPFDDGHRSEMMVSVGNPIMPNASRNQRVKKTFDRARDRLEHRVRSKIRNRAPQGNVFQIGRY